MPPRRQALDEDDLYISKDNMTLFEFDDPTHPFYDPATNFWKNPNDAIKRRINLLELRELTQTVAIKALLNFEIPIIDEISIEDLSFEELKEGEYQHGRSNSDGAVATRLRGIARKCHSFGQYKTTDDLSWVVRKHRLLLLEIFEYISKNGKRPSMYETDLYAIMRVVEEALDTNHILYLKINAILKLIKADIRVEEGKNQLNRTELAKGGLIKWQTVLAKQEELEDKFEALGNKQTKGAFMLNQDLVLLSLYCLIPPLRGEIKTLKFADNPQQDYLDRLTSRNSDIVLIEGNTYSLEFNTVKKRHGNIKFDLPQHLQNILKQSYTLYKRTNVFTDVKAYPQNADKPVRPATVANRLKKMFSDFDVGSSMLRSSYVTYMYNKRPRINYNTKKEMARRMRTSLNMMEGVYYKIIDDENNAQPDNQAPVVEKHKAVKARAYNEDDDDEQDPEEMDKECVILLNRKTKMTANAYEKHLQNQKDYYEKNKKKIQQKQKAYRDANPTKENRRKIISMLNKSEDYRGRIQQSTIDKYNIKQLENGRFI